MHISKEFDKACLERIAQVARLQPGSRIHLSGVCGTGMAAVLSLLKQLGFYCSGSDKAFYPPMGEVVRDLADELHEGYLADNIPGNVDLVVIGNALSRGNPEVEFVLDKGIPFASMPEVFSALLVGDRQHCLNSIVVCGTHGKTTTSAMMASLLNDVGLKPGYFVGGLPASLPSNIRPVSLEIPPDKRCVVLEGDEYDSAFFAKFSKFHCYRPDYLIITSIEFDHADIFDSLEAIDREFTELAKRVPQAGGIFYCAYDSHLKELVASWENERDIVAPCISYGFEQGVDARITAREVGGQRQKVYAESNRDAIEFELAVSGQYNALNALACYLVAQRIGVSADLISTGLRQYAGVARRQQILFESEHFILMEDFAHHPTAVRKTLQGIRESYPDKRILAVFEPRSNTSRRQYFQEAYSEAFVDADAAIILNVEDAGTYSKHDEQIQALDVNTLVQRIQALGTDAHIGETVDKVYQDVLAMVRKNDLVVLMSNGSFGGLPQRLKEAVGKIF